MLVADDLGFTRDTKSFIERRKQGMDHFVCDAAITLADSYVGARCVAPSKWDDVKVYSTDQLRLGQGGGTPLCPFDCQCCF